MVMFCFSLFVNIVSKVCTFFRHKPMLWKIAVLKKYGFFHPSDKIYLQWQEHRSDRENKLYKVSSNQPKYLGPSVTRYRLKVIFLSVEKSGLRIFLPKNASLPIWLNRGKNPITKKMHFVCKSFKFWQLIDVHDNM